MATYTGDVKRQHATSTFFVPWFFFTMRILLTEFSSLGTDVVNLPRKHLLGLTHSPVIEKQECIITLNSDSIHALVRGSTMHITLSSDFSDRDDR